MCLGIQLQAQVDYDEIGEVTSNFFIQNGNVYQSNGTWLHGASILIEDGKITAIGPNIKRPYDAQLIKADSMYIYPAFIDGLSQAMLKKEEENKERENIKFPGKPTDQQAGITPNKSIDLDTGSKQFEDYRKAGFGVAHIVPKGQMMPGKGSLVSLADGKKVDPILSEDLSLYSQFSSARGMYPSTIIGIMAKWRDLYGKAYYKQKHINNYRSKPSGNRPNISLAEEALLPVVNKEIPVYFKTGNHKAISRALQLKKELGFEIVLTDVKQGWMLSDKIKNQNIPILLSLDLPDSKEEDKEKKDEVSDEMTAFKEKKMESLKKYLTQASEFEKANIPFGFTTVSTKPGDVQKTLIKLKENGASEKVLIDAMTMNPAKLFGMANQLGSIDRSKIANLFISTKPYFEEGSKIRYTFVEGQKFEYKEKKKKKKSGTGKVDLIGEWTYTSIVLGEEQTGTMTISGSPDNYKIQMSPQDDPNLKIDATDISKSGNNLTYTFSFEAAPGQRLSINSDLDFDGDEFEGTISIDVMGDFAISGSKISNPE